MKFKSLSLTALFIFSSFSLAQVPVDNSLPPSYWEDQSNKMNIYRAATERINDLMHTKLDLKFDYQKEEVNGEAWITLKPHFYEVNKLTLDAKGMLIHEVSMINGKNKNKLKFTHDDWKIQIDLDKTYNRNQEYTVYINYTARPNEVKQKGGGAVSDAKGVYFINPRGEEADKPTQIWTQGEPVASSCWFPTIDTPIQKTSQEIYLTVEDKYVTLSNGKLEKQTKNPDGTRTDYWNFPEKHAPYLFFFGVGDFAIVKDNWKGKEVSYYVEREYEPYARDIFGNTPEMMTFFSELLDYEYPWNKYAQMVGRDYVSGAMENTTAVLHQERAQQKPGQLIDENIWEGTIAHELFHHWFGDLVTMKSFGHVTVNESFANYSEYLWREYKYGKEAADEDRYDDLKGYGMDPKDFDKNLVRLHYDVLDDVFDRVSYNKGGKGVLHMLRAYLGDEAFFGGMSKYLKDNKYGIGEAVHLRLAWEEVSGRDLNWFFDQWYFGNGHPKMNIVYDYNPTSKKVKVTMIQNQSNYFEFPITFDVVVNGKVQRHQVWAAKKKENTFEFDAASQPEVVIPNSDQTVLCDIDEPTKTAAEYAAQYKYGKGVYATRALALEKLSGRQVLDAVALNTLIEALNDPYDGIRRLAISELETKSMDVKTKAAPLLKKLAESDPKTLVQAAALRKLTEMGKGELSLYQNAVKSPSYSVQAAAAAGILKKDPSKISELKDLDEEVINSSQELVGELLSTWIANNDTSKLSIAAEHTAFFFFTGMEDPQLGEKLARGFGWVMSHDDLPSTKKIASQYKMVYKYYGKDNPSLTMALKNILDQAMELKANANKENPSEGYEEQIRILNETKGELK